MVLLQEAFVSFLCHPALSTAGLSTIDSSTAGSPTADSSTPGLSTTDSSISATDSSTVVQVHLLTIHLLYVWN